MHHSKRCQRPTALCQPASIFFIYLFHFYEIFTSLLAPQLSSRGVFMVTHQPTRKLLQQWEQAPLWRRWILAVLGLKLKPHGCPELRACRRTRRERQSLYLYRRWTLACSRAGVVPLHVYVHNQPAANTITFLAWKVSAPVSPLCAKPRARESAPIQAQSDSTI